VGGIERHGAVGVEQYREVGYLPEGLCNYLLRLGWGGDGHTELLSRDEAIKLFDINHLSKSPARFDKAKLDFFNHHYIQGYSDDKILLESTTCYYACLMASRILISNTNLGEGLKFS
jgi:glutamyl-tRNA synthetase